MDQRIAFGGRLKALRIDRGLSQEELAEAASLHRTYIGGVERGERNVSLLNIWRIADALGVSPSALFTNSEEPFPSARVRTGPKAIIKKTASAKAYSWTKRRRR